MVNLKLEDLNLGNWKQYGSLVLRSEKLVFPEVLQEEEEDYLDILRRDKYIAKLAMLNYQYIGNIIGVSPSETDIKTDEGYSDLAFNPKMIYIHNFVIEPSFQGRGFGRKLLLGFVDAAKRRGYTSLEGHFRQNASFHLIKSLGAEKIKTVSNRYGAGENQVHCGLNLETLRS